MPKDWIKKTSLTEVEQFELKKWLQQHDVDPSHLRRSFTDVMPLAKLLFVYYPTLVDVNYYPKRNSVKSKCSNWNLFNKRVLSRIGVNMSREDMDRVARSVPGSIDVLLHNVMRAHLAYEGRVQQERRTTDSDEDNVEESEESGPRLKASRSAVLKSRRYGHLQASKVRSTQSLGLGGKARARSTGAGLSNELATETQRRNPRVESENKDVAGLNNVDKLRQKNDRIVRFLQRETEEQQQVNNYQIRQTVQQARPPPPPPPPRPLWTLRRVEQQVANMAGDDGSPKKRSPLTLGQVMQQGARSNHA